MAAEIKNRYTGKRDVFTERYARKYSQLSPAFRRVADYIESNRIDVMASSALDVARASGVSDATVVRAVQALGFEGLHDLRKELAASYGRRNAPVDNLTRTWADVGENAEAAMDDVLESLGSTLESLRTDSIRSAMLDALKILHVAKRIAIFGVGPTAHIAAYFSARLRRKGRKNLLLNRTGAELADQLLEIENGDALLMLAYGKTYQEAEAAVAEACRLEMPVVLVTDSPQEKYARNATVVLQILRGRNDRVALHGATVACLEMLLLGLATTDRVNAITTLAELDRLRETTRLGRRRASGGLKAENDR